MFQILQNLWGKGRAESDVGQCQPGYPIQVRNMVWTDPIPLILPDANLLILFSLKAACTSVTIWFLHHLGHARAARDYSEWPHRYRIDVYYKTRLYRLACRKRLRDYTVLRVVRDPFERAVSSFRHVVEHTQMDPTIGHVLARSDIEEKGLSFDEFLHFLEQSDLTEVNAHYKIQRHQLEDRLAVRHLINISRQDLFRRLNEVEADLGLPNTDFAGPHWIHDVQERRVVQRLDGTDDLTKRRFTRDAAVGGPWPSYRNLLTESAQSRIARLYEIDVRSYT